MPENNDNIIIKRIRKTDSDNKPKAKSQKQVADTNPQIMHFESQYRRQLKIISLLIILIALLTLLALLSYSKVDEPNTQISFSEFLNIIKGHELETAKAQATQNWLGLLGAIIANFLYNNTLGYSVIIFPILIIYWAKYLFFQQLINKRLARVTVMSISYALLISCLMGIINNISWIGTIDWEWYGAFGLYISGIFIGFLGTTGSLIIIITLLASLTYFGFRFKIAKTINFISLLYNKTKEFLTNLKNKIYKPLETKKEKETSNDTDNENTEFTDDEPARIIKRNLELETDESPNPLKDPLKAYSQTMKSGVIINKTDDLTPNENSIDDDNIIIKHKQPDSDDINDEEENHALSDNDSATDNTENAQVHFDEELTENYNSEQKKLIITVTEQVPNDDEILGPINLLSTSIHDEEINYKPPSIKLLMDDQDNYTIDEEELKLNARILQEKLETFKIYIENLSVTPGPVVTQYEFVPAAGIKISRIESLADDIAMALKARGIRIIAPIPGKGTVGIEIPNQNPAIVRFHSCLKSTKFHNVNLRLPIGIGKTISGEVFTADLAKMPHLLIAGATGTGKSVGINTIICSLLFKMHPKDLKLVIIDPKKVEMTPYGKLEKHFLATSPDISNTIITDPQEAVVILKALCAEMDLRYDILSSVGQRNLLDYNRKILEGKIKDDDDLIHKPMPYIVVIIDELADLMLTASKEVETPIIRLAQLARAVGIHLVLATQRPSVDVITGIIKANFPARISYLVASKVESRIILDTMGAEKLLGTGDMLFQYGGSISPMRIQNAFLTTEEVEDICNFIGSQKGYSQPYMLPALNEKGGGESGIAKEDRDILFDEAARLVVRLQQASVSLIQRRLKVGYARAGRIIDELEATGIVGPFDGSKARTVLIESESELEHLL